MNAPIPTNTSTGNNADGPPGGGPTGSDPTASPPPPTPVERLHRCRDHRIVAGVAAGLADYLGVDTTLVRIGFVVLALLGGLAVPLYLAGWLLIPDDDTDCSIAEDLLDREGFVSHGGPR